MSISRQVSALLDHGVSMPHPTSVYVSPDVDPSRIASGVILQPGCRLYGRGTSIGPGCELGIEGPATVRDSNLGVGVKIASGTVSGAVLLDGVVLGPNVHVRPGSLLEEQSNVGHAVGLKQTVLMPFVTLGSLINFCDVLMAGGTSRSHHGEVGSSYVHFNFTPYGDKATASLVGDVPRGVLLDQPPVFLGGQGGLVGPSRLEYGTVIAAGTVWRHDALDGNRLLTERGIAKRHAIPFDPTAPRNGFRRIVLNNLHYLGNLLALEAWYSHVRAPFLSGSSHGKNCLDGARQQIAGMIEERRKRLNQAMQNQIAAVQRARVAHDSSVTDWASWWKRHEDSLAHRPQACQAAPQSLTELVREQAAHTPYLQAIRDWPVDARKITTEWLSAIVTNCTDRIDN